MSWILWVYLTGFASMIVLQHGMAQNPNCTRTRAGDGLFAAILWPLMVALSPFRK